MRRHEDIGYWTLKLFLGKYSCMKLVLIDFAFQASVNNTIDFLLSQSLIQDEWVQHHKQLSVSCLCILSSVGEVSLDGAGVPSLITDRSIHQDGALTLESAGG